jgi:hypothetical protein
MNARSCRELLQELGEPDPNFSREDQNIWGLLFGAAFSMQQAEWMMKQVGDKSSDGRTLSVFSPAVFNLCSNGFDRDLSEWGDLQPFFPWLSGFYLNSARLRTLFAFENTLVKCYRRLEFSKYKKTKHKLTIETMLDRVLKETQYPALCKLIAPVKAKWGKLETDEKKFTHESCLCLLHLRVNKFKHDTYQIRPPSETIGEFSADCIIHRHALSIAVDCWNTVRNISQFNIPLPEESPSPLATAHQKLLEHFAAHMAGIANS